MKVYNRGWYAVCSCEEFNIQTSEENYILDDLENKTKKYIFVLLHKFKEFTRFESIKKSWIKISLYNESQGFYQQKTPILKKTTFDYYQKKKLIIFHSGVNKVSNIIKFLNREFNSKIIIPNTIDLKLLLKELKTSNIQYYLIEGMIINHKLPGDSIGNFHFKNLTRKDYDIFINQDHSFLSWIKLNIQGFKRNIDIILYLNGTFYLKDKDDKISDVLKIYFKLIK